MNIGKNFRPNIGKPAEQNGHHCKVLYQRKIKQMNSDQVDFGPIAGELLV